MTDEDRDIKAAIDAAHGASEDAEPAQEPESTDEDDSGEEALAIGALAVTYLAPLLTAPERGPTARTIAERGVDPEIAVMLDGLIDYALDLVDVEMGDNLGPAGKVAIGLSAVRGAAGPAGDGADEDVQDDVETSRMSDEAREIMSGGQSGV
jgi:hypothetical protein